MRILSHVHAHTRVAGQARTFVHPAAWRSIRSRGVEGFGAAAYTFFYLTTDDPGSTKGGAAVAGSVGSLKGRLDTCAAELAQLSERRAQTKEMAALVLTRYGEQADKVCC